MRYFLLLLSFLFVIGSDGTWQQRKGATTFGLEVASWYFEVPFQEDMYWDARTVCKSSPTDLLRTVCSPTDPTIGVCCVECTAGQPTVGSSANALGCVCSPDPSAVCIDATSLINGSVAPVLLETYAVPIFSRVCRPLKFLLNSRSGDADLTVLTANPAINLLTPARRTGTLIEKLVRYEQSLFGDDLFFLCNPTLVSGPAAPISNVPSLNASSPISWVFLEVGAQKFVSNFTLSVSEVRSATDLLVPIQASANQASVSVECSSAEKSGATQLCDSRVQNCGIQIMNLFQDSPFAFHAIPAGVVTEDDSPPLPGLTVRVPVSGTTDRGSAVAFLSAASSYTNCSVTIYSVVNSSGTPGNISMTFDSIESVKESECDFEELSGVIAAVQAQTVRLQSAISLLGSDLYGMAYLYGALLSNGVWAACDQLVDSFLLASDDPSGDLLQLNSTFCQVPSGSVEWLNDPCCNSEAEIQQCCAPRPIFVPELIFVEKTDPSKASSQSNIKWACAQPKCSTTVTEGLLLSRRNRLLASKTCRTQVAPAISNPAIFDDVGALCLQELADYGRSVVSCVSSVDCYTNCTNQVCQPVSIDDPAHFDALKLCLLRKTPGSLMAVFLAGQNADDVLNQYYALGCDQGARIQPDLSLDTEEKCVEEFSCSSDPNLNQDQCVSMAKRFPNFCGKCDRDLCVETSVFPGCLVYPPITNLDECLRYQGTEWRSNRCYLIGVSSELQCLQPPWPISNPNCDLMYSGDGACPPTCIGEVTFLSNSSWCSCEGFNLNPNWPRPELIAPYEACESMIWNDRAVLPFCEFALSSLECVSLIAKYRVGALLYRGSQWDSSSLFSSASTCQGSTFSCSLDCQNCSSPSCGYCSDDNLNGYCFQPFDLVETADGPRLFCPETGSITYPDGCMRPNIKKQTCLNGGGSWRAASLDRATCEGNLACFEPTSYETRDGKATLFSSRNATECSKCGSVMTSPSVWTQATLVNRSELEWRPRAWLSGSFVWRRRFDLQRFRADMNSARSTYLYLAIQTTLSCLSGPDQAALSLVACDCDGTGRKSCYGSSLSFNLISTRVCGLFQSQIVVPGKIRAEIDQDTRFREGCLQLSIDEIDAGTFSRSSGSVVSSAFIQSLQLRSLSVVRNSQDVVIGQLTSDAYQVVFTGSENEVLPKQIDVVDGEFRICVSIRTGRRQSGWNHLGVARARAVDQGNFAQSTFRLWQNTTVVKPALAGEPYCFTVDRSGIYALANYIPDAKDATFFDTLTADQQAALIIVIVVYFFLWVLISIALVNYALWWLAQRTAVKFSVDQLKASMNFSLLWLASLIRWIYFLVAIVGATKDMPEPIEILMVELPLFFFFSVLTIIILKWLEVARKSAGKGRKPPLFSLSNMTAVLLNLAMYGLLTIFVILASVGVASEEPGKCSDQSTKDNPALSITYHLIVAAICFCLGASFIVLGTKVTIQLLRLGGATSQKIRFLQFTTVAGACSVAMILQAILLVVTTAVTVPSIVAILILIVVEVVPILLLIWTWNKPIAIRILISSINSSRSISAATSSTSQGSSTVESSTSSGTGGSEVESKSASSSGLGRLWSLGTDSLSDVMSVAEEE